MQVRSSYRRFGLGCRLGYSKEEAVTIVVGIVQFRSARPSSSEGRRGVEMHDLVSS
jgi:hypothetical protein